MQGLNITCNTYNSDYLNYKNLDGILRTYVQLILSSFGIITNAINIVIFVKLGVKEKIFIYFLALSISDLIYMLNTFVWRLIIPSDFEISKYRYVWIFFMVNFNTISSLIQLSIALNQLRLIKKVSNYFVTKVINSPRITLTVMCVSSALSSSSFVLALGFSQECIEFEYSAYVYSVAGIFFYVVFAILKNIVLILVLLAINLILAVELKKFHNQKKILHNGKSIHALKSKDKLTKMNIIMFILYFITNLPYSIVSFCIRFYLSHLFTFYLMTISIVLIHMRSPFNMFIYFYFNNKYRIVFLKCLSKRKISALNESTGSI